MVTGATGFVGSHLVEELIKLKAKVIATTHNNLNSRSYFHSQNLKKYCRVIKIDLTNFTDTRQLITEFQPGYIFHLAAQPLVEKAYEDPKTTLYSNILGTVNVLESARRYGKAKGIIVASSDKAYGKMESGIKNQELRIKSKKALRHLEGGRKDSFQVEESRKTLPPAAISLDPPAGGLGMTPGVKYLESDPLAGDHPYEVSKSSTDLISYAYYKTYGLPVVITRFGNIYGEGDIHFSRLVPGIMKALVKSDVFEIRSNGQYVRDYLYIKDVVRGYLMLAENIEKVKGEAFNFGSDNTYSVIDLIRLISQISQIKIKYRILNSTVNEIPYQSLDWSKIKKALGWKPEYKLTGTIKKVNKWYQDYFSV